MNQIEDNELNYRFLQRQWDLLDSVKRLRMQVPIITIGLILGITSSYVGLQDHNNIANLKLVAVIFVCLVSIVGIKFYLMVIKLYVMRVNNIEHLYKRIGVTEDHYSKLQNSKTDNGISLFHFMLFVVLAISLASVATITVLPVN